MYINTTRNISLGTYLPTIIQNHDQQPGISLSLSLSDNGKIKRLVRNEDKKCIRKLGREESVMKQDKRYYYYYYSSSPSSI